MSLYVVDANVVAKWFVPERLSEEAVRLLDERHELASPDLLWSELGNVLWKKARAGQLTGQETARIVQGIAGMVGGLLGALLTSGVTSTDHFLAIEYTLPSERRGGVLLRLHKRNADAILDAVQRATGVEVTAVAPSGDGK